MNYNELYHHGVKGQKWGIRRYQNEDGTLTSAGKSRKSKTNSTNKTANRSKKDTIIKGAKATAIVLGTIGTIKLASEIGTMAYTKSKISKSPNLDIKFKSKVSESIFEKGIDTVVKYANKMYG